MISHGKLTVTSGAAQEGSIVGVACDEGFAAQVQNLTCKGGEWYSFGASLKKVCRRKSCVPHLSVTPTNGAHGSKRAFAPLQLIPRTAELRRGLRMQW